MNLLILLLRIISNPRGISGILIAVLIMLVWMLGPRFGLDAQLRILITVGLVLVGVLVQALLARRHRKQAEQIEQSLIMEADASVATADQESKRSREAAREELVAAISALKKTRVARGRSGAAALSLLPWYLVLGRPEAGKSSLIRHSGLQVPGDKPGEIKGIGSSRHCDWWFTNQAVLLEAHNRFADIGRAQSSEGDWEAFLTQLRRVRPRVPLNGVVVAVPAGDLIRPDAAGLEEQARLLRKRLDELTSLLQVVCPVYVTITQIDRVHGFAEFFGDLEGPARHQIWGATLGAALMEHEAADKVVDQEFDLLYRTLNKRRLPRLVRERDPLVKGGVYLFPLEFHALREPLLRFVKILCAPDAYGFRPPLRGFYFTSGGGGGESVDVVLDEVSRVVGLPGTPSAGYAPPLPAPGSEAPRRPFFQKGLFLNVLVPDFGIARPTARAARREWWLRLGLRSAVFAALGALAVCLMISFGRNLSLIRSTSELAHQANQVALTTRSVAEVEAGLAELEPLRRRLEQLDRWDRRHSLTLGLGLYRGAALNNRTRDIYLDRLVAVLLGPSRQELEMTLRRDYPASQEEYTAFYDRYRVYRMILQPQHGDPQLVAAQLQELWAEEATRGQATQRLRDLIRDHVLSAWDHRDELSLHCRKLPEVDLALVDKANRYIRDYWKPEYFYSLMLDAVNAKVPPYTLESSGGGGILVTDARILDAGGGPAQVPGSFKLAGFRDEIKGRILGSEKQLREDWLLAEAFGDRPPDIRGRLLELYVRDYEAAWIAFLEATDIASEQLGVQAAADRLDKLARKDSALLRLIEDARTNLRLGDALDRGERDDLKPVLGIEEDFASVLSFDHKEERDGQSYRPDEAFIESIRALVGKLVELNQAGEPAVSAAAFTRQVCEQFPADQNPISLAHRFANAYCLGPGRPGPLPCRQAFQTLLQRPARAAWRACLNETERYLDRLWEDRVYAAYDRLLLGKYPFSEGGADAAVTDFAEFFGPEGAFSNFLKQELQPYCERDLMPKSIYGTNLRLGPDARQNLLRAITIRQALFREGAARPGVKFQMRAQQVRTVSGQVPYDAKSRVWIGSVRAVDTMGQQSWTEFTWPMDPESVPGGVEVTTDAASPDPLRVSNSAWTIFRLLDRAEQVKPLNNLEYEVQWRLRRPGDYEVSVPYQLRASASVNPFARGFFDFHCPLQLSR